MTSKYMPLKGAVLNRKVEEGSCQSLQGLMSPDFWDECERVGGQEWVRPGPGPSSPQEPLSQPVSQPVSQPSRAASHGTPEAGLHSLLTQLLSGQMTRSPTLGESHLGGGPEKAQGF